MVLVGGISELYQGDLDLGRIAVERLAAEPLGPGVVVEDLYYGAVAVCQRIEDLRPHSLVLIGAARRGRPPGTVERRRVHQRMLSVNEVQTAVGDAVTGYVSIDLIVQIAAGFGTLPQRVVAVEVEPASTTSDSGLSPEAVKGLEQALELVRAESRRALLLQMADELGQLGSGPPGHAGRPSSAGGSDLREALSALDEAGHWQVTPAQREWLGRHVEELGCAPADPEREAQWRAFSAELERLSALETPGPGSSFHIDVPNTQPTKPARPHHPNGSGAVAAEGS